MRLLGYSDRWSVARGSRVDFKVSSAEGAFDADYVRLQGGPHPAGVVPADLTPAPFPSPGRILGKSKALHTGSYVRVPHDPDLSLDTFVAGAWLLPTRIGQEGSAIFSKWANPWAPGWALLVRGGRVTLELGGAAHFSLTSPVDVELNEWLFAAAIVEASGLSRLYVRSRHETRGVWSSASVPTGCTAASTADLIMAAMSDSLAGHTETGSGHFDGRLEAPAIFRQVLAESEIADAWSSGSPRRHEALVASWDFSTWGDDSRIAVDVLGRHHGHVVNNPGRAVRGVRFDGSVADYKERPDHYGAIHFHSDDIEDAGWESDFSLTLPEDAPSGVYAARLVSRTATDFVPFIVPPVLGRPEHRTLVLLPTMTYLAYGNERFHQAPYVVWEKASSRPLDLSENDAYAAAHPELGPSLYDVHADGTINTYVSRHRPIVNFRPHVRAYWTGAARHFAADLYLLEWLDQINVGHEIATDEDLDDWGVDLLSPYAAILLGSHPEYWSLSMLRALAEYLQRGGRAMYLGGNGLWWVTSRDPRRPHILEVRKSDVTGVVPGLGVGAGEARHSTTGEIGGTWRQRGLPPESLVGVGYTSQGFSSARPYRRTDASYLQQYAHFFEGIDAGELIGTSGLAMGGAAGDEFDRVDYDLGSPRSTVILASSFHHDRYCLNFSLPYETDAVSEARVRSDIALTRLTADGAVFAAGSMCWIPSMAADGFKNNAALLTENVLRRFLQPGPVTNGRTLADA